MNKRYLLAILMIAYIPIHLLAQRYSDAHIIGHVTSAGKHLPFASVSVKGTTLGSLTDETGHFQILHVEPGTYTIVASMVGYSPMEVDLRVKSGQTSEIKFDLEKDVLNINQVVVTSDRSEQKRREAPVIVSTLSSKVFEATQSNSLGEGLVFTPGIRLENNCQNCGFSQVRLNGMEGPYSQILINSRPIFSGLAGVYGLELIPANMIDRVEVVRGGGSALYGSNAIAGTINVILKDPVINSFEASTHYALTGVGTSGDPAGDYVVNMNTSLVSNNNKTGMTLYGYTRERQMFDANADSFSELSSIENLTLGGRVFHRMGNRAKISFDLFTINEDRNGGNMPDYPLHERDIAEAVEHHIKTVAMNYEQFFRDYDLLSIYASGQYLDRDSYYGANQSLADYGHSTDFTWNVGVQYKAFLGHSTWIAGLEQTSGVLKDEKLGYPDVDQATWVDGELIIPHIPNTLVAHQKLTTTGAFTQYELTLNHTKLNLGARLDQYQVNGLSSDAEPKSGLVFSPRITLMQELFHDLQVRASYAQGYRAPQIFDEDLHIETSGVRQVIHVNDPDLMQENSHSITASLDLNTAVGPAYLGFLVEGFYTRLENPFVNVIGSPDETGRVLYTRTNAENGATVQGANMELKLNFGGPLLFNAGMTVQQSRYDEAQEFNETHFFRTPNRYGYVQLDYAFTAQSGVNLNGTYTGPMLVPYFGMNQDDPMIGELRTSGDFFDMGIRGYYTRQLSGLSLEWFAGVKNVFHAYQSDFDRGIARDPAYIYGPMNPRTIYFGLKISNASVDLDALQQPGRPGRGLGRGPGRGLRLGR